MPKPPHNIHNLSSRIAKYADAHSSTVRRIQRTIANTVVGQMLPPGVVKGGTAIKVRVGEATSRFTTDLDAARGAELSLDDYLEQLEDSLASGWGDFTGTIVALEPHSPADVPDDYVMRPFDILLAYRSRHWLTVRFELGRDEVGSTERREPRLSPDITQLFDEMGLLEPEALLVMAAEHQVVQKLHACTHVNAKTRRNERAHDLVDIQILDQDESIDMAKVHEVGVRLFASRRAQTWPPTILAYDKWDTLYSDAAEGLQVLSDVNAAIEWANDFVKRSVEAGSQAGDDGA